MRKFFIAAALAVVGLCGVSSSAEAAFQLRITTTSGFSTTITDETVGDGLNGMPGAISFSGAAGNFTISLVSGLSKPVLGSAAFPQMDLNFSVTKFVGSAADDITIELTDTGFTTSPLPIHAGIGGSIVNNVTSVTYQTFFSNTNTEFDTSGGSSALQTFTSASYSGTNTLGVTGAAPYSLTQRVVVYANAGSAVASGDATLNAAPAPAGLVLALVGMPVIGLGAYIRRRRAVQA
jgi:hypothetical protein